MRNLPLSVLLSFPAPNYVNPHTRGPAIIVINAILLSIMTVVFSLRIYTRLVVKRCFGWDDYSITLGYIFTLAMTTVVLLANDKYMWNRHIYDVPLNKIPSLGKVAMAAKTVFSLAATFIRLSLLLFYYRLVGDTGLRGFRNILHCAVSLNMITGVVFVILSIAQCSPIAAYWTFPASGRCLDEGKLTLGVGVINCFLDILTTTLPIPLVMRLNMRRKQKLGVVFLLSLGFIVTIAGSVRTYYIWKSLVDSYDETWYSYPLWISAAVEIQLGVITACIPPLRPFISKYITPLDSTLAHSSGKLGSHSFGSAKPQADKSILSQSEGRSIFLDPEKLMSQDVEPGNTTVERAHIVRHQTIEVRTHTAPQSPDSPDSTESFEALPKYLIDSQAAATTNGANSSLPVSRGSFDFPFRPQDRTRIRPVVEIEGQRHYREARNTRSGGGMFQAILSRTGN